MVNQHFIVTGAAGNLGRAVIGKLILRGDRISAIISPSTDTGFMRSENLNAYPADLVDPGRSKDTVTEIIGASGPVNAGILMVGGFSMGNLSDTGLKDIYRMIDLNFSTAYNIAMPLLRHFENTGQDGQIIFIGARPVLQPELASDMLAYTLSKSLLFKLSEIVNSAEGETGIYSSLVIPGIIDTPRNRAENPDADFSTWVTAGEVADNIIRLLTSEGKKLREGIIEVYGRS